MTGQYAHIIDWFPTLANIIQDEPEKQIASDGGDLGPVPFENGDRPEPDLYWIWHPPIIRWALQHEHWKIVGYGRGEPEIDHWQLFYLDDDPEETDDVASNIQWW